MPSRATLELERQLPKAVSDWRRHRDEMIAQVCALEADQPAPPDPLRETAEEARARRKRSAGKRAANGEAFAVDRMDDWSRRMSAACDAVLEALDTLDDMERLADRLGVSLEAEPPLSALPVPVREAMIGGS
jgi:hypothetical protein